MKTKKNENLKLEKYRPLFFWFGMTLSMLLVISAFEWKTRYDTRIMDRGEFTDQMTEIIPITVQDEPKPPEPKKKVIAPVIVESDEIDDLEKIEIIIDTEDLTKKDLDSLLGDITEEIPEEIFNPIGLEKNPMPMGGYEAFYTYVAKNVKYPAQAQRMGLEGKVFVQFIVDQTGKLTSIEVMRGIGAGCDEEAVRVLKNAPIWEPGKQRGRAVKVRMVLPITFKLQ